MTITNKILNFYEIKIGFYARTVAAFILLLSAIRLLFFRLEDFLPSRVPFKDSAFFLQKYEFFLEHGWFESIVKGASPVFNAFVWLLDLFIENPYQSMKFLSMISMIATILLWVYFGLSVLQISKRYSLLFTSFLIYLAFFRNAFFSGTNDGLFCLLICLGIVFLFKSVIKYSPYSLIGSAIFFALAFGTREIFIFYLPGIVLILILIWLNGQANFKSILAFVLVFLIISISVYFPTLAENQTFKFADKNEGAGNWAEKNYLQVYLGENQISFQEVETFKSSNPNVILPQSYSEAIFLDLKLTVSNFVRQLILIQKPFIWQIGILFLMFLSTTFWMFRQKKFLDLNVLAFILFVTFTFSFSILLINRVEFRWFMVFPFLFSVLSFQSLNHLKDKYPWLEILFLTNILIISILNFGLIGVWK